MSMPDPELKDVERFYARQRREILERITSSRSRVAGRRVGWLAAAAVLALTALGLMFLPSPQSPSERSTNYLLSEPLSLPLSAFGTWSEEEMLDDEDADMGSIEWLLDHSTSVMRTDAFPDFLEPFGVWTNVENSTSISST
jgi:hypothetical protein